LTVWSRIRTGFDLDIPAACVLACGFELGA
jgi:hypothetical protein